MDNYIGKHLLVDCYGCDGEALSDTAHVITMMSDAADQVGMDIRDTFCYEKDAEITVAAYGNSSHLCIHAYPDMEYAAIDIYSLDIDLKPAKAMTILRKLLHPERIRATSVKRGNINPDMKPATKTKSTTMRKFKTTTRHINAARKKVAHFIRHKKDNRDGLGPE